MLFTVKKGQTEQTLSGLSAYEQVTAKGDYDLSRVAPYSGTPLPLWSRLRSHQS
jgi:hypothetical protein